MSQETEYRLDPAGFEPSRRRIVIFTVVFWLVIFTVVTFIQDQGAGSNNVRANVITFLVSGAAIAFGSYRAIRRQREGWGSFVLIVSEDCLIRRQVHVAELRLGREEVLRIKEFPKGGLLLEAGNKYKCMYIPESLVGLSEVKQSLAKWSAIVPATQSEVARWISWLLALALGIVPFVTVMAATEKLVVVISGMFAVAILSTAILVMQWNPYLDRRLKRTSWMVVLPLMSILVKMYYSLR